MLPAMCTRGFGLWVKKKQRTNWTLRKKYEDPPLSQSCGEIMCFNLIEFMF